MSCKKNTRETVNGEEGKKSDFSPFASYDEWIAVRGLMHVTVSLKGMKSSARKYEADFLVDTGAIDSLAPAKALTRMGVSPAGKMAYELTNGTVQEYQFGLVQIEFMGEVTTGRVIFGPDEAEPLL